jgi:hypothetical protein
MGEFRTHKAKAIHLNNQMEVPFRAAHKVAVAVVAKVEVDEEWGGGGEWARCAAASAVVVREEAAPDWGVVTVPAPLEG